MSHPSESSEFPSSSVSPLWSRRRATVLNRIARIFYGVAARLYVTGIEHIPDRGACVLVFNHLSNFDAHLIFSVMRRPDAAGLVAAEYRSRPVAHFLIEAAGGIWIDRTRHDVRAIRTALRLLEQEYLVGISPEGRRTPTGALVPAKPGAAYLAIRSGASLIPVALTGTEQLRHTLSRLRRPVVTVRIGAPFRPSTPVGLGRKEHLAAATEDLMARLASLLPPSYRGSYGGMCHACELPDGASESGSEEPPAGAFDGAPDPVPETASVAGLDGGTDLARLPHRNISH